MPDMEYRPVKDWIRDLVTPKPVEVPKVEPKVEVPVIETPKVEVPIVETPKVETPVVPVVEAPKIDIVPPVLK